MGTSRAPEGVTSGKRPEGRRRRRFRLLAIFLGLAIVLALGEVAARIVTSRWSASRLESVTRTGPRVGRYETHHYLPYELAPSFEGDDTTHDRNGFRGAGLPATKPGGSTRVVCLGASTTYGIYVDPEQAYPAVLQELLRSAGVPCDVANAGVPGWVSYDVLLDLQLRLLALKPDAVVVYMGRNEVLAQSYNNFAYDYSHYLRRDYNFATAMASYKRLFRVSHLAMLACTWRGERFGWSSREAHPGYGSIQVANMPTAPEAIRNLAEEQRGEPYRENLRTLVAICRARGIDVVLCTMACRPQAFATGNLDVDPSMHASIGARVAANNDIMRSLAAERSVALVETAALVEHPDLFRDDCHMYVSGQRKRAEMIAATLAPLLAKARPPR